MWNVEKRLHTEFLQILPETLSALKSTSLPNVRKSPIQIPSVCKHSNRVSGLASAAAGHILNWAGMWWDPIRELSWGPCLCLPACCALPCSAGGAASLATSVSGALPWVIDETHVLPAGQGLLSLHILTFKKKNQNNKQLWLILFTFFMQKHANRGSDIFKC